jgi:predicted RNase H-like HicB family nuclease
MITQYIHAAMKRAIYEKLSDGTYYGEIPGFQGVYANAGTLEVCREMLQEVLEGWLVLGHQLGYNPVSMSA